MNTKTFILNGGRVKTPSSHTAPSDYIFRNQSPNSIKWTALLLIIMGPLLVAPMDLFCGENITSFHAIPN